GSYAFKYKPDYTPNDPFEGVNTGVDRWDESNPGGGTWWLESINARNAWGYSSYFSHMNIGIVDSGFDTAHPDLTGKIVFPSSMLAKQNIPGAHGTHVAGIIAAQGNNETGICGICQDATLTCVDWEPEEGQVWIEDLRIIFGVGYAVKAGAKVVNLSVGSSVSIPKGKPSYPKLWMNTEAALVSFYMGTLINRGYDFLVVQSAGNGDSNGNAVDTFNNGSFCCITEKNSLSKLAGVPTKDVLDRIIIVGCARNLGNNQYVQSSFSNVGSRVSICAPGSWVYSCSTADNNYYQYMSGTSMAAPVVTAVASLVWSVNPLLTGPQVKSIVCSEANTRYEVPATSDRFWSETPYQSYRLVNAKLAVEAAIKTTHNVGIVAGRVVDSVGNPKACEIKAVCGETEYSFCSDSDGYFDFILPPGESVINLTNSDSTFNTFSINVIENETIDLTNVVIS
ncbi:MAG: S8 family serine peptidase, partial [Eubacteriales bacterium]